MVVFLVSGFWHGANWTFIAWGLLNALYFMPLLLLNGNRKNLDVIAAGKRLPSLRAFSGMLLTFGLTVLAWIFFRAEDLSHAFSYLEGIFLNPFTGSTKLPSEYNGVLMLVSVFILLEWLGRESKYAIEFMFAKRPRLVRWLFYATLIFCIGMFMQTEQSPFIYFQF